MTKKENRLGESQIKRALQRGRELRGRFFKVKAYRVRDYASGRLAVVISKKTLNQATDRNLCRRRVKAAFGKELPQLAGWEIVVLPRNIAKDCPYNELEEDVKKCADQLRFG